MCHVCVVFLSARWCDVVRGLGVFCVIVVISIHVCALRVVCVLCMRFACECVA